MRFIKSPMKRVVGIVAVSIACCVGAGLVVDGHGNREDSATSRRLSGPVLRPPTMQLVAGDQPRSTLEAELVTIRPAGFEPADITRSKGLFLLAIENRSGIDGINVRLDKEAGSRLRQIPMSRLKQNLNWSEGLDLPPGSYILSEADHPEWICRITITAR
jgi:hypothetical protein